MLELDRTEEVILRLANEDRTHIATGEQLDDILAIGGYVQIFWVLTRCP